MHEEPSELMKKTINGETEASPLCALVRESATLETINRKVQ